ncbi:MAG: hypothetical protein AAF527_05775 [Pseudomonadota bacterium]
MSGQVGGFGGDEVQEESSWAYPLAVLLATLVLSGVFLYYYLGPGLDDIAGDTPKPTISDEPVLITVGDETFQIPVNHTVYPRARRDGPRESVSLYALWPNLSPYTPARRLDFIENAPDTRRIDIVIERNKALLTEAQRFEKILLPLTVDPEGQPTPFGLTSYSFRDRRPDTPLNGYRNEDLYVDKREDDEVVVIRCLQLGPDMQSPFCRRDFALTDGVSVSYLFKRVYLPQWRGIDEAVQTFVGELRTEPAPETAGLAR